MRRAFRILALLCAFFLLAGCFEYEVPSYVGEWRYEYSEPDLGPGYEDSWFRLDRNYNYVIYDAPSGQRFSGDGKDFAHVDGLVMTLTTTNDSETRVYEAELQYLKGGKMKVYTSSVNGVPTVIHLYRADSYE